MPFSVARYTVPAPVRDVAVVLFRKHCICYGEQMHYDPVDDAMTSQFVCGRVTGATDCRGCPVCSGCGQLRCTCWFLGISINVKLPLTISTVAVRGRVGL
jgi:hypothetical protein